ncbi:MAG: exodeoxyribonuclease VII small subunit [Novosphingopyxis baekryungensis]|jgi:exodeoxyribonuclease VII small subunit|uniref:exodeoxyribonuclease VII small subunit n=1 Tax=Novosphingopyxis baekryungensis TaxID=279369 RepID=UPI00048A4674|nr:exodeoxyribonuclease VII small subunit [Novosphingopyxis baekryungensis]MDE0934166.1 exodeoxyribonuclease VII small subunit [Novosphingopyxis baekryungensis]
MTDQAPPAANTAPADQASPTDQLSFEESLKRLEDIVNQLERGDVPLDKSIDLYAEGDRLRAQCQKRLDAARAKIDQIRVRADGTADGTRPFDD